MSEKRILPRLPLSTMTFKLSSSRAIFQVDNISSAGMGIQLKNGEHSLRKGDAVVGLIHWQQEETPVAGKVVWAHGQRVGLAFPNGREIAPLLSPEKIVKGLKALHFQQPRPPQLKYWLKAASVLEIFVWAHGDGEYRKIQILFGNHLIEWRDGQGIQTGTLIAQQDKDTPLFDQDEWTVQMDSKIDLDKIVPLEPILQKLTEVQIPPLAKEFLLLKFHATP